MRVYVFSEIRPSVLLLPRSGAQLGAIRVLRFNNVQYCAFAS